MGLIIGSNSSAERVITVKNRDGSTGVWHISNQKSTSKSCNRLIFLSTFLFCYLVIFSDVWYTDNRGDNRAGDNI